MWVVVMGYRVEMLWNALLGEEEEEEEEIFFYCPVRGCSYKAKSLAALKKHFSRFHGDLEYYCPICGFQVKTVYHCMYYGDEKHLVLYYLVRRNSKHNRKERVRKARELAYNLLRDRNFKF